MKALKPATWFLAAAVVSACGGDGRDPNPSDPETGATSADELLAGAPDVDALTIDVTGDPSEGFRTSGAGLSAEIDEATQALGSPPEDLVEVRGAGELRVKESDRIKAMVAGLGAMGA